ncbi:KTSC domain-containing protein [Owenweeksia hongkongensis]|uniref:KTSC domain-containing protein n=1 Tax=Owenweeksia hongkongensis TaxID=253245 RepID=UPI003A90CC01
MKRIKEYKKLFNVEGEPTLKELKTSYRNLVKEWHPDKFQEGDEKAAEAELVSRKIIDGYHFLVSMAQETIEANLPEYTATINESGIADYDHKGLLLTVTFMDGNTYEYFGVNRGLFLKFNNSDKQMRFGKRNIFQSFPYRKAKKEAQEAQA